MTIDKNPQLNKLGLVEETQSVIIGNIRIPSGVRFVF